MTEPKANEPLIEQLDILSRSIAAYLARQQLKDGTFSARDFYGKAFAAALWARLDAARTGNEYGANIKAALAAIRGETIDPATYHYEFNRFALAQLARALPANSEFKLPRIEGFRGTRVANWTLLRAHGRYHAGGLANRLIAALELRLAKLWFGRNRGLIEDARGAYTMQYHAFSVALLGELLQGPLASSRWLKVWFRQALDGFCELMMPGGQCNYVGRGAFQSFGYGAAILALAHGHALLRDPVYVNHLATVLAHLRRHQDSDGALPLVLSGRAAVEPEGPPESFDLMDPRYPGWWSYNNYYDYLPFTGLMLALAQARLQQADTLLVDGPEPERGLIDTRPSGLRLVRKPGYRALVALPGKVWAAAMPMPFIGINRTDPLHRYPMPAYGGEQLQASLYSIEGLPLPILETGTGQICCADARYRWISDDIFEGQLASLRHQRAFEWRDREVIIRDDVAWGSSLDVTLVRLPRLLLSAHAVAEWEGRTVTLNDTEFEFSQDVTMEPTRYFSPSGYLVAYTIEKAPGNAQSVSCELTIRMGLN